MNQIIDIKRTRELENQRTRETENQRTGELDNRELENQRTREPENQRTREPENQRTIKLESVDSNFQNCLDRCKLGHLTNNKRLRYNQKEWSVDLGSNIIKNSVVQGVHTQLKELILN